MTGDVVRVEGADRVALTLGHALDQIGDLAPPEVARYGRDIARAAAPIDTGRLRASITSETDDALVSISSDLIYAPVQNFGWAAHGISAQPFLIPTVEDAQPVWGQVYVADTRKILATTVKGA